MSTFAVESFSVSLAIVIPLGVVGNALLITLTALEKELHTSATLYHGLVAVAGLLHSVTAMPWFLLVGLDRLPLEVCGKTIGCLFTGITLKVYLSLAQAVDRWIFVFKPLRYYSLVTTRRTALVCLACVTHSLAMSITHGWITYETSKNAAQTFEMIQATTNGSVVFSEAEKCMSVLSGKVEFFIFLFYGNSFLMLASVGLYCSILILARKRAKSIGVAREAGTRQIQPDIGPHSEARHRRGTVLLLTSVFLFVVAWLPLLTGFSIDTKGFTDLAGLFENPQKFDFYAAQIVIINVEMCLNQWFMVFLQSQFRRAAFRLFVRWLPVRGNNDS